MDQVPVVAAVIQREKRFLVGRRPEHKRHGGLWEFPGGKIDAEETDFEAIRRELAEELDLEAMAVGKVVFESQDPESPFLIRFIEVKVRGEPRAIEHSEIGWFEPGELARLPLAPSDARFVERHFRPPSGSS